ncbi:hypothetical protein EYB45_04610 [Erythrobacteraceae bacterium CFH 75059]|uniref:hypothetical protein n=1 Tax=Qipengyuania thermophila TaxID=2509361 RepID=UPI00101E91C6|nr:hypothetical protein [Qipengyuania thermophila]TCD04833.1 hypothetical protein EYB45_04610 [Erythrobacteraceae bacterium CFH 75059]
MAGADEVIFVYNADGGLASRAMDAVHKIVRPETYACDLCMITHGALTMRREWRTFTRRLGVPNRALHRDEFAREFPGCGFAWPAVIARSGAACELLVSRQELAGMTTVAELATAVERALSRR